jgi:hypothetical protein
MLSAIVSKIPSRRIKARMGWLSRSHWFAYWCGCGDMVILTVIVAAVLYCVYCVLG